MPFFRQKVYWLIWCFLIGAIAACNDEENEASTLYTLVPSAQSGITFQQYFEHDPLDITGLGAGGNGLAVGDINGDNLPDMVFTGGKSPITLYLNKGNLQFENITANSKLYDVNDKGQTSGVAMADVNGDGLLDIYVLKRGLQGNRDLTYFSDYGGNLLFINNGDLTFSEESKRYNLNLVGNSAAANFFDYDNDGDLDLYLVNLPAPGRTFDLAYYKIEPAVKWYNDIFMENKGGVFEDVTDVVGLLHKRNIGQSLSVADVNNDGWMDVFVANDFYGRDFLYINNGDKTFIEKGREYFKLGAMSAMGSDFADIDQDGYMDLFVGEMMPQNNYRQKLNLTPFSLEIYNQLKANKMQQYTRNMLYHNNGGQGFAEIGLSAGVHATEWSWGSIFGDMDNDGNLDLFVANGIKRDMTNMDFIRNQFDGDMALSSDPSRPVAKSVSEKLPSVVTPNYAFRNLGDFQFENVAQSWGLNTNIHSRCAVLADLDNDGDLDLVLNNIDSVAYLYQNHSEQSKTNHYLRIRLQGDNANTYGLGAKVTLFAGGKAQVQQLSSTKGFSASPEPILHFGLGGVAEIDSVKVEWLGGKQQTVYKVAADQLLVLKQAEATAVTGNQTLLASAMMQDVSAASGIGFKHTESDFNDFKKYRINHRKVSAEGPTLAVGDVDGDGLDDFYIGGAVGSNGSLYRQISEGKFETKPFPDRTGYEDVAALFFDANGDGHIDLIIGSGSLEFDKDSKYLQDVLYMNDGKGNFKADNQALPAMLTSTGSIAASDYDKDGDLDLFIGGRVLQDNYPLAPRSYLLINDGGKFSDVTESIAPSLLNVGMVTSALWSDHNQDGYDDLIVVGEWMPITVFENKAGERLEAGADNGLTESYGWWNTIMDADMDGDGDIDYVAGNWGNNSFFKASTEKPVWLYANDFDGNGTIDPVVFRNVNGVVAPFVNRDLFCSQMPAYNNQYYTFEKYANATLENMFDDELKKSSTVFKATEMRTSYIENLGNGKFKLSPLPNVAQLSPINAISCLDVNQDGHLDIVLAGNTTSNHFECGPTFGLTGLVLLGDGKGNLQTSTSAKTGFYAPGEVKAMATLNNGKMLLISNNNSMPQLFVVGRAAQ